MLFCTLLAFLLYDFFCGYEVDYLGYLFTRWSTWVYLLFFSLLFSMPAMVWDLRKTQAIIITILSLWLWASILYFRQFQTNIPLSSYSQILAVTNNYSNSITALIRYKDLLFVLPIAGAWFFVNCKGEDKRHLKLAYWVTLGVTFILSWGVSLARHGFEGTFRGGHHTGYTVRPAQFTPVGMLLHDVITRLLPISSEDSGRVQQWSNAHNKIFQNTAVTGALRDKVIVVVVESLDSWVVNAQVEGQPVMPTLNKLAGDSTTLYAPHVISQARDGKSSDGQYIITAGLLPLRTGAIALDHPESARFSLIKAFSEKYGVNPRFYDCSSKETWNKEFTIPALGFRQVYFKEDYPNQLGDRNLKKIRDKKVIGYLINHMQKDSTFSVGKPWFVEVTTATSHYEYHLPPDEKSTLQLTDKYPGLLADYLRVMRYVDESVARLIEYIESREDSDRISVVITGDHYAPGLEHCRAPFKNTEQQVPFIVINSPIPGTFDKYMGQVDIYTTLLDLFCPEYPHRGLGVSILGGQHPGIAISGDGTVFGHGSQQVVKHLSDAFDVSDLILRYDLLKK